MSFYYPYLPTNPLCSTNIDPCAEPCKNPRAWSSNMVYKGPNLPCTGIDDCDTLSTAIQKIEAKICEINTVLGITTTTTTTLGGMG